MAWAVVVAAGKGARAGLGENKVLHPLAGVSVLTRTLRALAESEAFEGCVLVLARADRERYTELAESEGRCPLVRALADGGATRSESVYSGLLRVPEGVDIVAVHDAARPFVTPDIIRATLESARLYGSGVICSELTDTVKRIDGEGMAVETPPRSSLRAVQTPQAFRRAELMGAYEAAFAAGESATDDASVYERHIGRVRLVTTPDAERNRKLTTREDFARAERDLRASESTRLAGRSANADDAPRDFRFVPRVGTGFDAHRLAEGYPLVLCGVRIPYARGLKGHSDADVAVHALMDAMLGAAGLGDIGLLFPDSDPAYAGISSMRLLARVADALAERGLRVANFDLTIVAQSPRLAPYREEMRRNLALALEIPTDRASVKATTTERMGYEGAGEGISAQAVVALTDAL